jgi:hypothetical protein
MTKVEIKQQLNVLDMAIRKHKHLAQWGNVESRERLKILRNRKKQLIAMEKEIEEK